MIVRAGHADAVRWHEEAAGEERELDTDQRPTMLGLGELSSSARGTPGQQAQRPKTLRPVIDDARARAYLAEAERLLRATRRGPPPLPGRRRSLARTAGSE